jgi:HD-GYP domain-containing protein (c-di-GMP phosphodiesterase class II)
MTAADRFLHALAHALRLRVRPDADPVIRRASEDSCAALGAELLKENVQAAFHFSDAGVRYGALALAGFEGWPWARLLAEAGIVRMEVIAPPTPATLAAFLDLAVGVLPPHAPIPRDGIRWSGVDIALPLANDDYPLDEELGVMRQLFVLAERGEPLRQGDVMALVASLTHTLTHQHGPPLPLLHTALRDGYQPAHALNTALLAMAVADAMRLAQDDRRECGLAALLHDIGMARLPGESATAERFSSQDRARVRGHPLEGARLLLRQSDALEGAAVVSYEHHLRQDGSGYPRLNYPREPHLLSRVVAVCDAFDALLAPRQDRPGYEPLSALREIERSAVTQFDARVVGAFSEVVVRTAGRGALTLTLRPN